ncbi:GNAT family N-acetyltransferase [Salinimicrobium sp. WS361]|uniref:GNAT family N-acetyltransferase n=1 Tax=Salinimicrobium sp. WS361 TaxID=3425123 RepID=UPI003D6EF27E
MLDFRGIDYQRDIGDAVKLIQNGLDSSYTEAFFRWKHLENPFGESYGLVATDQGKIIGLRMFMFWKFINKKENKILTAIRPVDTIIDREYRGKGLFKILTQRGLEECKGNYDLIFNTPNQNSLSGYLKMGWEQKSPKYFKVGIIFPAFSVGNLNFGSFPENINSPNNTWETLKNKDYLKWRFQDENYKIAHYKNSFIIYSIATTSRQNQMVIQEVFGEKKELKELLRYLANIESTFLSYYYPNDTLDGLFIFEFNRKKSVVVVRNDSFSIGSRIIFSLGDLEGKL